jgi:hypothetical protein
LPHEDLISVLVEMLLFYFFPTLRMSTVGSTPGKSTKKSGMLQSLSSIALYMLKGGLSV